MKRLLFLLAFCLVVGSTAYAGVPSVLEDGDGVAFGTSANPIKVSLTGGGGGSAEWRVTGTTLEPNLTNQGNNVDLSVGEVFFVDDSTDRIGIGTTSPDVELDVAEGNIEVGNLVRHNGDSDTQIEFETDRLKLTAGGAIFLDAVESTSDTLVLNQGGDIDVNIKDSGGNSLLYTDAGSMEVGIGTSTPAAMLDVNGDLSVVTDLTVGAILWGDIDGDGTYQDVFAHIDALANYWEIEGAGIATTAGLTNVTVDGNLIVAGSAQFGSMVGYNIEVEGSVEAGEDLTVNQHLYTGIRSLSLTGNTTLTSADVRGTTVFIGSGQTATLPAVADGHNVSFIAVHAGTSIVDSNASDSIWLDGVKLDDGDSIDSAGIGGMAVCQYYSAVGWWCSTDGWTDGGAS